MYIKHQIIYLTGLKLKIMQKLLAVIIILFFVSCDKDEEEQTECSVDIEIDQTRGDCSESLSETPQYSESINGSTRTINANCIPDHEVGLFGSGQNALNPNAISAQNETYNITTAPAISTSLTSLLSTSSTNGGPKYSFGILFNGVELDPVAAEPFPHEGMMSSNVNWEWNLEALNVNLGLDCNNAHVQPTGKYHYHGVPSLYLDNLNIQNNTMTMIGYAADGFPVYYKYAYQDPNDNNSPVVEMKPSYQLKSGERPGDGETAPCGSYDGVYSNDYEFIEGLGTLDQANGRTGVTPEYPQGTYYYVITDDFPSIPRYFKGTPSADFKIGG